MRRWLEWKGVITVGPSKEQMFGYLDALRESGLPLFVLEFGAAASLAAAFDIPLTEATTLFAEWDEKERRGCGV